ncbi:flavin reductase family protein [Streptomyces sp. ME19-01-6]|uniref:flavin reductase family protein n=1 Tax=Streptomyces sp. ME19-01-6 TaxID=3028686 RepID=UPI0029BE26A3|nr:flavin reductase family protein [Streptomyces sp. ME19-01-6]MDX3225019.1 flavin reductase family protein [Streptomyces sp. ME19-01-6]
MAEDPPPADPGSPTKETATTDFRQVMSGHAAGVAVVTAGRAGSPAGLTVTSLTSFSDLPPSICFNIGVTARSHQPVINADAIGVHMLAAGQRRIAEVFSSRVDDKFSGLDWSWDGSVPRLPGALAYLLCLPVAVFRHGDHSLVVAEVKRMEAAEGSPLVYLRRSLGWQLVTVNR